MATQILKVIKSMGWVEVPNFSKGSCADGDIIQLLTSDTPPLDSDIAGHSLAKGQEGVDVEDLNITTETVYVRCTENSGVGILAYEVV